MQEDYDISVFLIDILGYFNDRQFREAGFKTFLYGQILIKSSP